LLGAEAMQRAPWIPVVSLGTACSTAQPAPAGTQIDDYISSLPYLAVDAPSVDEGMASAAAPEGDYACTRTSR
jgi:hypothetical protein